MVKKLTPEICFNVSEKFHSYRIDKALVLLSQITRSQVQLLIGQGLVLINNQVILKQNTQVKTGDQILIKNLIPLTPTLAQQDNCGYLLDPSIIYEDDDIMVIDKPAGLSVYPGNQKSTKYTLVDFLKKHCTNRLSNVGGDERPGIVHRLDKDTSGLMIIAKNNTSHLNIAEQIRCRDMKRIYNALIWGVPTMLEGVVENYLVRDKVNRLKMTVTNCGKFASTFYKVIKVIGANEVSLVECNLNTGRTHQIRAHMSHMRHSIVGDQMYGKNDKKVAQYLRNKDIKLFNPLLKLKRQALHSTQIIFKHPTDVLKSNELMVFNSQLPPDLHKLFDCLNQQT